MLNKPEPTCLVIADLSGYTGYLAAVELDHAQDILADLIDTVVGALRPTFRLAKLEGDAAFMYAGMEAIDGPALMDTLERTYFAFRRRLRDIGQASACDCNACIRIPDLDLKILAHHGLVVRQRMAGREELVGSDVIVAHRLLKNDIEATTGIAAYAAYTGACIAAMGADPVALGLTAHRQAYEHLGEVELWVADLGAAWTAEMDRARVTIADRELFAEFHVEVPSSPATAWDYLTSPSRRLLWQTGTIKIIEDLGNGRRGTGTVNHCVHGKAAVVEEILDWRPFEYVTLNTLLPIPGAPKLKSQETLEPLGDDRTMVQFRFARPRLAKDRAFFEAILPDITPQFEGWLNALAQVIGDEMDRRLAEGVVAEPDVPASAARFITEPVHRPVDSGLARSSSS
jgi:hypothetical protein